MSFDQNRAQDIVGALIIILLFSNIYSIIDIKWLFLVSFCIVSLIRRSSMTSCIYQLFRFFFPPFIFVICLLCHWWRIFYMVLRSVSISTALNPGALICLTFKNAQTTAQLHSYHMLVKQCSKFSKPGFSNTWTVNSLMFTLVLEKAEESEIKLPTSAGSWKKQESSRKTSISALLTMPKPLTVWITINWGKFWKR